MDNARKADTPEMSNQERTLWYLEELGSTEDIDCNHIEIYGEDGAGNEVSSEVSIPSIAEMGIEIIGAQEEVIKSINAQLVASEQNSRVIEAGRDHNCDLLAACQGELEVANNKISNLEDRISLQSATIDSKAGLLASCESALERSNNLRTSTTDSELKAIEEAGSYARVSLEIDGNIDDEWKERFKLIDDFAKFEKDFR